MTRTTTEREEFLRVLALEAGDKYDEHAGRLILRHAVTHGRLAEAECNGTDWRSWDTQESYDKRQREHEAWVERRTGQIERRLGVLAESLGVTLDLSGDPRGYTVKLKTPRSGKYNTWGGAESGWGVPQ